ncbi:MULTISPECIES: aldo/keto reductase [unclassified Rhodococcus (in: high G+C Gram-positive bacteria)]|uniref:aldo/keto reductase n=1 Tax=unclassified Rhodococcus (in: high G+C Gram-positive bacteria) TaxID=192944 RepID=UPI000B9B17D0|nr:MULTISPECIES: aldo/keto reductase [unclassified Rhodococcus (in: high G+C Gram-positive bacteria)]OZE31887.1 alcohol dehydrogenase [Rhodococcus sp. 05-2254-4]OZE41935.1 alcohol dehydrogenase [Rhodococcus sp. 05-2254-3]OZE52370.1 alcohol dehydrogenase [Rhodococcus sp. 05-2254-2]
MVTIGTSSLEVYPLALGGNTFGWTTDEDASFEILDAFTAGGGNFIDTADSYSAFADGNSGGESETVIGNWTAKRNNRDDVVIATKVSQHPDFMGLSASNIAAAADASLARLQSDHIDLYYAHYDDETVPLVETLGAFDALVTAGKVRYVAISNYSPERIREWVDTAKDNGFAAPVALQPEYNLVARSDYEGERQQLALDNDLGVFPYFALAAGFLTGKYRTQDDFTTHIRSTMAKGYFSDAGLAVVSALDDIASAHSAEISSVALAWLLAQPGITAPIASASKISQLPGLLAAPALTLASDEIDRLTTLSDAV